MCRCGRSNNGFDLPCSITHGIPECEHSLMMPTNPTRYGYGPEQKTLLQFANKQQVITTKRNSSSSRILFDEEIYVRAPKRVEHGDWKTQAVRKEFMGLRQGECGIINAVFENFEGRFVTVQREDGKEVDCRPSELEVIDKAVYEFTQTPKEFLYRTDHVALPEFAYDRDVAVGHEFRVESEPGKVINLRVVNVIHEIRARDNNVFIPIRITLQVIEF